MPLVKPRDDESRNEFVERCMNDEVTKKIQESIQRWI
jgi:hypothetical protein